MKRIFVIGIILVATGCKTASPQAGDPPAHEVVAGGPFEVAETAGVVERMHAEGPDFLALVATADGAFELLRVARKDGQWVIVDRTPAAEDYLWPEQ